MPQVKPETLREVTMALREYERETNSSKLQPKARETYIRYAQMFVRWLSGEFVPGGTL